MHFSKKTIKTQAPADNALTDFYKKLQPQIRQLSAQELGGHITAAVKKRFKMVLSTAFHYRESSGIQVPSSTITRYLKASKPETLSNGIFLYALNGNSKSVLILIRMGYGQSQEVSLQDELRYELALVISKKSIHNGKKQELTDALNNWRQQINGLLYHRYGTHSVPPQ